MVEHGQKYYVLLEKSGSNIATLMAHAPNEEAAVELKVRNYLLEQYITIKVLF
jgi:hypothetical protein